MFQAPFAIPSALFLVLGLPLVLGLVPPNPVYGLRTRRTLADPASWYRANRRGGLAMIAAGGLYLAVAASGALPYRPDDFGTFVAHLALFVGALALGLVPALTG
jgi:hypothetical protein